LGEHPTQQQVLLGVKLKTGLSPVQVRPSAPQNILSEEKLQQEILSHDCCFVALGVDFEKVLKRYKLKRKGKTLKIIDKRRGLQPQSHEESIGGIARQKC
jgi:hypothetical protein